MVELIINGRPIELMRKGQEIKYNRQIADVFDIASVSSSYTNSFIIPKTPNNTEVFEHLGIVGDQSTLPYSKVPVTVRNNGFDLITNGWLNISSTDENYKCSIIDGMVDFFKAIENKTLGVDLDLTNFTHNKDIGTVVASFDNEYYNYIIADFGGKTSSKSLFPTRYSIIIDYLVPSFNVKKLLELVMSTFGYTYVSAELDTFLEGLWITYPTPPTYEASESDTVAELLKGAFVESISQLEVQGDRYYVFANRNYDSSVITEGQLLLGYLFQIEETAGYSFNIEVEAYAKYSLFGSNILYEPCVVEVQKNGTPILTFLTDPYNPVYGITNVFCQAGDVIKYVLYASPYKVRGHGLVSIHHNGTTFNISKINQGDVTPSDAFKDFKIKDFFKELLYRTGLTPIADNITKEITFIPISQRIDLENAIDWTDKYIQRTGEVYLKNSYSQRNLFKMKYNEGSENKNDGVILVNNRNIDDEKTLVQSVFYSPEEGTTSFRAYESGFITTAILPMFTKEVDTGDDGEVAITYKELDNRFYFVRRNTVTDNTWKLESEIVIGSAIVDELHFATTEGTLLGQLVELNFADYAKIFNNFRAHTIELALGFEDHLSLDLTRPYYFEQEAGYYILNKLPYQDGETTVGEFVRINQ